MATFGHRRRDYSNDHNGDDEDDYDYDDQGPDCTPSASLTPDKKETVIIQKLIEMGMFGDMRRDYSNDHNGDDDDDGYDYDDQGPDCTPSAILISVASQTVKL
ncbi:hypothetical protein SUGI_1012770 [Cryptomeria japonica]|nr:hypothetical protein SUGI_1012770 [Cryptomeria japonica]